VPSNTPIFADEGEEPVLSRRVWRRPCNTKAPELCRSSNRELHPDGANDPTTLHVDPFHRVRRPSDHWVVKRFLGIRRILYG
jgi:hypothetical protein